MMHSKKTHLKPGATVVLLEIPPGFLTDLPIEDQNAIEVAARQPLTFIGYDDDGRADLEFTDSTGVIHFIYVDQVYVQPFDPLRTESDLINDCQSKLPDPQGLKPTVLRALCGTAKVVPFPKTIHETGTES